MLMNTFWKSVLVWGIFFLQVQKDHMLPFIHLHFKVKLKKKSENVDVQMIQREKNV